MDYFLPTVLSMLVILLSFGFLISGIVTFIPLFVTRSSAGEILPLALKASKLNIGMMVGAIVLTLIAHNTPIGESPLLSVSIGFLVWAVITHLLVAGRMRMLLR